MSDADRTAAFIRLAAEELAAAKLLSAAAPRQAAYFLQQAAEKAGRALLTEAGVPFGTSHNLGQIAAALPTGHPLRAQLNALDRFSTAATKFRYPSPTGRLAPLPAADYLVDGAAEIEGFIATLRPNARGGSGTASP